MGFVAEWLRLAFVGDTVLDRCVRAILLVAGLGVPPILQQSIILELAERSGGQSNVVVQVSLPLGWGIVMTVVALYLAITAGAAWVHSRGPTLLMADALEEQDSHLIFRLRLRNMGAGRAIPQVMVDQIVYDDGQSVIDAALLPIELQWSHQAIGTRAILTKQNQAGETVGVVGLTRTPSSPPQPYYLYLIGAQYKPALLRKDGVRIYIHVTASLPDFPHSKPLSRWFCFRPVGGPFYYQASTEDPPPANRAGLSGL